MQTLVLVHLLILLVNATKPALVSLFQDLEKVRWGHFYPSIAPSKIRAVRFDEVGTSVELVEISGWPVKGAVCTYHFDGSPLEVAEDRQVIGEHLERLFEGREMKYMNILALENCASETFVEEIGFLGFCPAETWTIMAMEDLSPFTDGPADQLPESLEVGLIDTLDDFKRFVKCIEPFYQHFYRDLDEDAVVNQQMRSWGIFEKDSGECVCTAQLFNHGQNTAIVGAVSTAEKWRRRGLASHLMAHALQHAIKTDDIQVALLQATSMAINMYKRMGFQTVGATLCCQYDPTEENKP